MRLDGNQSTKPGQNGKAEKGKKGKWYVFALPCSRQKMVEKPSHLITGQSSYLHPAAAAELPKGCWQWAVAAHSLFAGASQ